MSAYDRGSLVSWNTRLLNALLAGVGVIFLAWTVSIWVRPEPVLRSVVQGAGAAPQRRVVRRPKRVLSYSIIARRDPFRASRSRYAAPVRSGGAGPVVSARTPLKAPNLTLLGTVILDNARAAIIGFRGMEKDASYYRKGETIGGYTITRINRDSVLLENGNEVLSVPLSKPVEAGGRQRPGTASLPRR